MSFQEVERRRKIEEAVVHRKRSSRIALREVEKEEARLSAVRKVEEDEKMARARRQEARAKKEEAEREKREHAREQRRLERETRERKIQSRNDPKEPERCVSLTCICDGILMMILIAPQTHRLLLPHSEVLRLTASSFRRPLDSTTPMAKARGTLIGYLIARFATRAASTLSVCIFIRLGSETDPNYRMMVCPWCLAEYVDDGSIFLATIVQIAMQDIPSVTGMCSNLCARDAAPHSWAGCRTAMIVILAHTTSPSTSTLGLKPVHRKAYLRRHMLRIRKPLRTCVMRNNPLTTTAWHTDSSSNSILMVLLKQQHQCIHEPKHHDRSPSRTISQSNMGFLKAPILGGRTATKAYLHRRSILMSKVRMAVLE